MLHALEVPEAAACVPQRNELFDLMTQFYGAWTALESASSLIDLITVSDATNALIPRIIPNMER